MQFKMDGSEDTFTKVFRMYSLPSILLRINEESTAAFDNVIGSNRSIARKGTIIYSPAGSSIQLPLNVLVMPWDLVDVAYYAIKYGDDYKGKQAPVSDKDFLLMVSCVRAKIEQHQEIQSDAIQGFDVVKYMWAFSGEQFKFEEIGRRLDVCERELYILFSFAEEEMPGLNLDKIVYESVGAHWKQVLFSLRLAHFETLNGGEIGSLKRFIIWDQDFTESDYDNTIAYYSASYNDIRDEKSDRQVLYRRPYIQTKTSGIIGISAFLSIMLCEHWFFL